MSKLAKLMAEMEGYFVEGSIAQRHNNPGDIEHAPGEWHSGSSPIGSFYTPKKGWAALQNQLEDYANRGLNLSQMVDIYAPPSQNDTTDYLDFICEGLGVSPNTLVKDALLIT